MGWAVKMKELMKIAFLLPSLKNLGPIIVVKDIIDGLLKNKNVSVTVFYFDDFKEDILDFSVNCIKISFFHKFDFNGFDIIHTHGIRPDLYTKIHKFDSLLISTQHNVIYDEYIINNSFLKTKVIESIWKFALTNKDLVISIGGAASNYYHKLLPHNKIVNIPNGRTIANNQGYGCSEDDVAKINILKERYTCIGTCTRAIKRKGHAQIIQALPNLPDFCFVLIGDGDYIEFLKKLAYDLKVDDRCLFLGYRKNATEYLNLFDIYAQTSYTESISIALLEAAAAKKAVVCSLIPPNIDVFQENEVIFFNLDDIDSLTQALLKAQRDREMLEINIYKKYKAEYTSEVMVEKYYNLYKGLTSGI